MAFLAFSSISINGRLPHPLPHVALLYFLSLHVSHTNSRTSNHLRLDPQTSKVEVVWGGSEDGSDGGCSEGEDTQPEYNNMTFAGGSDGRRGGRQDHDHRGDESRDRILDVLTTRKIVDSVTGHWTVVGFSNEESDRMDNVCSYLDHSCLLNNINHQRHGSSGGLHDSQTGKGRGSAKHRKDGKYSQSSVQYKTQNDKKQVVGTSSGAAGAPVGGVTTSHEDLLPLDCGKPPNVTAYDTLVGIAQRFKHPNLEEKEVAVIFKRKGASEATVDMAQVEKTLRKKSKSVHLYNQIGNYWRVKGNTRLAIECFRKALFVAPNSADVLLNLAKVLFNLKYLDDAILLTRKSLEIAAPTRNVWLQHFTLGEILQAYGNVHEALQHYRHTLELNPHFGPAKAHVTRLEEQTRATPTFSAYTLIIVVLLLACVVLAICSSSELGLDLSAGASVETSTKLTSGGSAGGGGTGGQRHINRGMAIRSVKK